MVGGNAWWSPSRRLGTGTFHLRRTPANTNHIKGDLDAPRRGSMASRRTDLRDHPATSVWAIALARGWLRPPFDRPDHYHAARSHGGPIVALVRFASLAPCRTAGRPRIRPPH